MQEAGHEEQAASYATMTAAARQAATAEEQISGQKETIATQQQNLATETRQAGQQSDLRDFLGGLMKGAAAVANLVAAPATGGASLLITIGGAETSLGDGSGLY
jgi:hypothetical protein